ncbi:hypothetical protein [Candidatus Nitrotoga sp. M5]|uniref:hypothetical protein n=1 Tax=Candidatus Nitrotoga sp. M5 TaxID=2890409 RepID=UPI001EF4457A|nr:hypothetical protein [Candidatus Nitrotoga sp. M5]
MNAPILFGMALGRQAPWQVNDISFVAKFVRFDTCMKYHCNELLINLVHAGNGSSELEWANS